MTPDLSSGRAVVVGNGNVALDVARILVTDPDVLAHDRHRRPRAGVAARPAASRRWWSSAGAGRCRPRSPRSSCASWATSRGGDVDVIVDPADFADITDEDVEPRPARPCKQNIKVLRGYAEARARVRANRRIVFRFCTSPIEIKGDEQGRVDRAGPQRTGHRRQRAGVRQGHRRARGTTRSAGGPRGRLPRCADPGTAVRREDARRSPTPTAGSKAAATNTSSGGSSAGRPA